MKNINHASNVLKAALLILPFISTQALAEYQFEAGAAYSIGRYEFDSSFIPDLDADIATYWARGYLQKVSTENVPYDEAGFLSQETYLEVGMQDAELDWGSFGSSDYDVINAVVDFKVPEEDFRIKAGFIEYDFGGSTKPDSVIVGAGMYLSPTQLLEITVINGDFDEVEFSYRQVRVDTSSPSALEFTFNHDDDQNAAGFEFTYYPEQNQALGMFAQFVRYDDSFIDDNSLEFGGYVNFWINPNVSIGGLLSVTAGNIEDNVTSADSDYIGYSAGLAIEGRI